MKIANLPTSGADQAKPSSATTHPCRRIRRLPARLGLLVSLVALGAAQALAQPYSIWSNAVIPGTPAANDPTGVELGLKFKSAVNGSVTGIRFYKGPGNTGTHVGNLWTTSGTLLGSVTFVGETAEGWQQQALAAPVAIDSNTTYVVSYYAPAGNYAVDLGYFFGTGFDSPPLRALADGEDGPNGVYRYNPTSIFPGETFMSANYWVDVVFLPEDSDCAGDTNPPTITIPADVILPCADCDTDPANTGIATATDECNVTVDYGDEVSGECPKVVKRTWIAIDGAGNTTEGVQTITCLPPNLVTDSSGCIFDRDPSTAVQDFRLVFIQDPQNWPNYKLAASNPGQFFYNVFFSGTPGQQATFDITLPYPFVTQGANPIHAYDWVNVLNHDGQQCLSPGDEFFVSSRQVRLDTYGKPPTATTTIHVTLTVPDSGFVFLAIHLDYGLKGTTGYSKNLVDDAVSSKAVIPNHGSYNFAVAGAQTGTTSIENINSFKRIPGVGGLVLYQGTLDPVPDAAVTLANANGVPVASGVTDEDGFYMLAYKHTGKAANYSVSLTGPPPDNYSETKTIKLKANAFVRVDFLVP